MRPRGTLVDNWKLQPESAREAMPFRWSGPSWRKLKKGGWVAEKHDTPQESFHSPLTLKIWPTDVWSGEVTARVSKDAPWHVRDLEPHDSRFAVFAPVA